MRRLFIVATLAFTYLAATGAARQIPPPECAPNCPWVR
jgi:hypothetical protein